MSYEHRRYLRTNLGVCNCDVNTTTSLGNFFPSVSPSSRWQTHSVLIVKFGFPPFQPVVPHPVTVPSCPDLVPHSVLSIPPQLGCSHSTTRDCAKGPAHIKVTTSTHLIPECTQGMPFLHWMNLHWLF